MAHLVTCLYCGKKVDRDKVPMIKVSARRYAHPECAEHKEEVQTQEQKDLEALEQYIMKLFDEPFVNARARKQINEYKEKYDYTYSGMLKTLIWWYEIKNNSIEKANGGIGIIPFAYKQACDYYYALYLAQMGNVDKRVTAFKTKEIEIGSPRVYVKPPRLFDLGDDEDE